MPIRPTFSSENTKVRIVVKDKSFKNPLGNILEDFYRYSYFDKVGFPWTFHERLSFVSWGTFYCTSLKPLKEYEKNFLDKYLEIEAGKYGY